MVLGDEAFHLEFVHDPAEGVMDAFVLDGHMEEFVRINAEEFTVSVSEGDAKQELKFAAKASEATGEKIGDTSQFSASADWLKTATNFDAVIPSFAVRSVTFTNVAFKFPEGNE